MAPHFGNNGQLSREERVELFGIDCDDQLIWTDWTPGTESVNDLVLQNVALVTQKVRFVLPPTTEFDMPYPEPFKLAPGMKKSIPISFRPSKYVPHVDKVQIITKGGSFFVTVKAVVKEISITVTHFVDFGLCPTNETSEMFIDVYNTGTLNASLKWHAKPPFTVVGAVNQVEVGQSRRCKVAFNPETASVFDALIVCEAFSATDTSSVTSTSEVDLLEPKKYIIQSTGVGKMPHLCIPGTSDPVVDFGAVFPGNRVPRTIEILNTTPVRATFRVRPLHDGKEPGPLPPAPFVVDPQVGEVGPMQSATLTFYFQSHTIKESVCQRFQITTPGGTPLVVTCRAFCCPMTVRLSKRSVNFGEVDCGKVYSRTLQLHNDSDRPAVYHFPTMDQLRGIFWFDRHMGIIPPDSFMVVTVYFGPLLPINYYKSVPCLVKGSLAPMTLHLIGSAHSEKARPARLEQDHVDLFRNMQLDGVYEYTHAGGDNPQQDEGVEDEGIPSDVDAERPQEVQPRPVSATQLFLEAMLPMDSKQRDITIHPEKLNFGACSTTQMSDKQVVTITNRTSQKVCVAWMVPGETRMTSNRDERSLFTIYPVQCDIKPLASAEFVISFRPQSESNYEGGILEALVYQKMNRSFRLVDKKRFTPPWYVSVRGMGHSMGNTRNDPRLDISESNIRFRACCPGQRTYQVAMLTNPGDTCIAYQILDPIDVSNDDANSGATLRDLQEVVPFRCWPTQGVIAPHKFNLVALEFAPVVARNQAAFAANIPIVVDYNEGQPLTLRVCGRCWEPQLSFCRGQAIVTFPPTCSGIASNLSCEMKNVSEIPISFECKIPSRFRNIFWFPCPTGTLEPSESTVITAHFCPDSESVFSAPMYCSARGMEDPGNVVEGPMRQLLPDEHMGQGSPTYVLQFVGHGKGPSLSLDPDSLDFGAVKACDEVKHQVTILNSSNLVVHYTVTFEVLASDTCPPIDAATQALDLGITEGSVEGRCTDTMNITFKPSCRGYFEYRIVVTPKGNHGNAGACLMLRANVQYPFIQIADLRTECTTPQPQSMMWQQFQVDDINALYRGEVADDERLFQAAIGIDEKKQLKRKLKPFQLLFGTSAAGSTPTVVHLVLSNKSDLPVVFSFQTPKKLSLEDAPYWCDEKSLVDGPEAHFNWVEEHDIYDITPLEGEITPGDYLFVKMTYHHHSTGIHMLPVVFNVHDGRSVMFYLKGHSVAPTDGCLSVRSSILNLRSAPIGLENGPGQPVELTNSGFVAAPWRIDMQSIFEHNSANHDFEVLRVWPVEGILDAQSTTFLHFTFTPLEAKSYSFPVRIEMLKDGRPAEELLFELRADGFDPEGPRPANEPFFPLNLPLQTYAPVPGCGAALSIELLDFGSCPTRAAVSRMLVLVNYSSEFVLSFRWETRQLFRHASALRIEPNIGELSPGSHCITVFRLFSTEPLDISGEVACLLEWTHLSEYGQKEEVTEHQLFQPVEYLAFHTDHMHEPMTAGRNGNPHKEQRHVSVANRLTVSRFRNLMSSAAGQKFLNENLHRTAMLASHIPTMSPRKALQATGMGRSMNMGNGTGGVGLGGMNDSGFDGIKPTALATPTASPLYVRILAVVADWEVPDERRDEFLIIPNAPPPESMDDTLTEWQKTRKALRGEPVEEQRVSALSGELAGSVMGYLIREIIGDAEFSGIVDHMIAQDTPLFLQYENSPPPGDPNHYDESVDDDGGAEDVDYDVLESLTTDRNGVVSSSILMDFQAPELEADAGSRRSRQGPAGKDTRMGATSSSVGGTMPSPTAGADAEAAASAEAFEDNAQRYWDEALQEYGEVDLEAFRAAAGEALDMMLLDLIDEVIGGKLNWMRPLPRMRPRR